MVPGQGQQRVVGRSRRTPGRWVCSTARTCSPLPGSRRRRPGTTSPPPPRPTTARTRRATWSTSRRTSPGRSWPTCGRPACGRSASTASRPSRSTWPASRRRRSCKFWGDLVTKRRRLERRRLQRLLVPGTGQRQVRHLPIAAWGPVFLQGTAGKTSGQVAGRRPAAVGCRQGRVQQLGRLHRRGAEVEQEPHRRLPAGLVHQHRQGVGAQVRHRAVPVPGDERRS